MRKITLFLLVCLFVGFQSNFAQTEIPQADATLTSGVDFVDGDIYTDSGGTAANYANNESSTLEFVAGPTEVVTITFTAFDVEAGTADCWDTLTVIGDDNGGDGTYSGDGSDGGTGLGCTDATDASGNPTLGPFTSSLGGSLSFNFESDSLFNQAGWEATITVGAPPGPPIGPFTACSDDTPGAIDDFTPATFVVTVDDEGVIGPLSDQIIFENILLDIQHLRAGDMVMTLTSPEGTILDLSSNNGGTDGLDMQADLFFMDGEPSVTTWTGGAPAAAGYEAEGGMLNTVFAGESITGDWTLVIEDGGAGDDGDLFDFCLNFSGNGMIGDAPTIACPGDIVVPAEPGVCESEVNFGDAIAIDTEDGSVPVTQTMGDPSGSSFPVGVTTIEFSATDSDGNTATCTFTITVEDNEDPVAVCQDITVTLDASGNVSITAADVDNGSSDNCSIDTMVLDQTDFTCSDVGENTVTLTVTDPAGNTADCTATVTVVDDIAPVIQCEGAGQVVTENFDGATIPAGWTNTNSVGTDLWTFGSGDMPTGTDFPTNAAIFDSNDEADDASLTSPVYDLDGSTSATLSFTYAHQDFAGNGEFFAEVWDGSAWVEVLTVSVDTNPTDSGPIDVTAFANADFQVRFRHVDGTGTLDWGSGVDNFFLEYQSPSVAPFEVVLDANGTATVAASDLITSVDEVCGFTISSGPLSLINECGDNLGAAISSTIPTTSSTANVSEGGIIGTDFAIDNVQIDITHTWDSDLDIFLISPSGTSLELSTDNGGLGDNYTGTVFQDGGADITAGTAPFTGVFEPEGGTFAATFDGEDINGDWTLEVTDDAGGDDGTLNNFCINFTPLANANFTFDCSNLGTNTYTVYVTDDAGNETTCEANVNVVDNTAPVLICEDTDVELGADGTATIDPYDLLADAPNTFDAMVIGSDNGSGSSGTTDFTVPVTAAETVSFDWIYTTIDDAGFDSFGYVVNGTYTQLTDDAIANQDGTATVTLAPGDVFGFRSVTDDNTFGGNETVVTNFTPGFTGQFAPENWTLNLTNSDGDAFFVEIPGGELSFDACGIDVITADVTEVTCADIGTPITVNIFAVDASGNTSSCSSVINVVDTMAPELTCPADMEVDTDDNTGLYTVEDFIASGDVMATDNCTDAGDITLTQDPAAGTTLGVGDGQEVTITAEDEYGNVSTCTFELDVVFLGVEDNALANAVSIYPNPANEQFTLANGSNIVLDSATIVDINGRVVRDINLTNMVGSMDVNVADLATGVYIVKIAGEGAVTTKRLIKE